MESAGMRVRAGAVSSSAGAWALLTVLALPCVTCGDDLPFRMDAKPIVALEHGPVLVENTRAYFGKKAIEFDGVQYGPVCFSVASAPDGAKKRYPELSGSGVVAARGLIIRYEPGRPKKELISLHSEYSSLPAGRYVVDVAVQLDSTPFLSASGQKPTYRGPGVLEFWGDGDVEVRQRLVIEVQPASASVLKELVKQQNAKLDNPKRTPEDVQFVVEHVVSTRHPELCSLMLRLVECPELLQPVEMSGLSIVQGEPVRQTLGTQLRQRVKPAVVTSQTQVVANLLHHPTRNRENREALIERLREPNCQAAVAFFALGGHLSEDGRMIDREVARRLASSKSAWVRAILYTHAPESFDAEASKRMLAELSRIKEPRPVGDLKPLIEQLDSPAYDARQDAARKTRAMGDIAVPALREVLESSQLSTEVRAQVNRLIAELRQRPSDFDRAAMDYLEERLSTRPAETGHLLGALAKNHPDFFVAQQAQLLLPRKSGSR